jgi:hypothetical protein
MTKAVRLPEPGSERNAVGVNAYRFRMQLISGAPPAQVPASPTASSSQMIPMCRCDFRG